MSVVGAYTPGSSVVHRMPAGWKLLALLAGITAVFALHRPWQLALVAVLVGALFAVARIPGRLVWRQLRPMRALLAAIAALQLVLAGWQAALTVCSGLLLAAALAALLTLTTRVSDILDVCGRLLRPLARVGVDPDRVGLVLAMTIRCIPLLTRIVGEVGQARKARGLGWSFLALAAPAVVRALRTADAMGEALIARGVDD